jgi:heterodisulfide reductase subunit A
VKSMKPPRIGVYVCHCGLNIAGSVDCKAVSKFASTLPHVVTAREHGYLCSDQGQELIRRDIKEHRLNRVVVAACSPQFHESTFRRVCEEAGLNRFLLEIANIREQCSWVHLYHKRAATEKAKDLVSMAVAKAPLLKPGKQIEVPVVQKALVIGGGVAGIQAALDLADTGYNVYLVEREPSIGGRMAQIDKTFPTMDCSICILAPKMSDAGRHKNIELLVNSEVTNVDGYVGNFRVKVQEKPRFVSRKLCNGCGECSKVCPIEIPNEFDANLIPRKAIYIPFAQAVPSTYSVDIDHCIRCYKCVEACQPGAIDFAQEPREIYLEVGTIVVATGAGVCDPSYLASYGYLSSPNVVTSLEFERLINAGGPSGGRLIRPSDMQIPKSVAFIQCVGSRSDRSKHLYCSAVCCMNTVKDSLLIKEHWPDTKIQVFYIDMRAFGKGFEDLYKRAIREGVTFIRGLPSEVVESRKTRNLLLKGEDTLSGRAYNHEVEMVVLSIGIEPRLDSDVIRRVLRLSRTSDGFFAEAHPKLKPVDTPTAGIFIAGCVESPKDIKDSVTQASAAAARASILMAKGKVAIDALPRSGNCLSRSSRPKNLTDEQICAQVDAATEKNAHRKIIAFCCDRCSCSAADSAGMNRMQYPASVRVVRTMCLRHVAPKFVKRAFERRAAAVLVAFCPAQDSHNTSAFSKVQKSLGVLWKKMEAFGVDKRRLGLVSAGASECELLVSKIGEMQKAIERIKPEDLERSFELFKQL